MAYIVPSDIKKYEFNVGNSHELETLAYLRKNLTDDFTVFHGVHWSREYQSWTHFGEIDFVVLHKRGKLLCIEQKNGALDQSSGTLIKHYGNQRKDVADQIHRSVDKVREKFKWVHGNDERLNIDYLIYCPDYRVTAVNAAGIDAERVVDAARKDKLAETIGALCADCSDRVADYDKIERFFRQTFELVPDIHAHKEKLDKSFVRNAGSLAAVVTNLEMHPFHLKIEGAAGSGKSLVVQSFMEKQRTAGKRLLFLCFNRLLAEKRKALWQQTHQDNSVIQTFYGFCCDVVQHNGNTLDYRGLKLAPESFWQEVLEQVMAMNIDDNWRFDTLIVDEGQDFHEDWYEIAKLFLSEDATILWLEDKEQRLTHGSPVPLNQFVTYRCLTNYRSPDSIARFILKMFPLSFEIGNPLPGLGVEVHEYKSENEQPKKVDQIVQNFVRQGFTHKDIVIVSCRGARKSVFSQLKKIGNLSLSCFTGQYDQDGRQIMTEGQLRFDSIYRFKGLEAPAVILVDIEFDQMSDFQRHVLFCGMTRATVKLDLLINTARAGSHRLFLDSQKILRR